MTRACAPPNRTRQRGFTIVELSIAIAVAGVLAVVIFEATFDYYADVSRSQTSTDMALVSQNILNQMTGDVRLADAISNTNSIPDPNAPSGGWQTSNPSNVIIIESPALDSSHNIIYDPDTGFPYRNEFIYFVNGGTMYKRVLANPSAPGNTAVTTCPADKSSPSCPPDILFSDHVSNLSFTFYDSSDNTTADATQARSVLLEVDLGQDVYGRNVALNNQARITLRNQ